MLYPELEKSQLKSDIPDIVVFNQPTTNELSPQALLRGIRAEVSSLFGDYGSGAVSESLSVKYLSPATSTFILRVSRAHYQIAWAALSMMKAIPVKGGKNCVFKVVRVSGTVKKAEEEAIRRAREIILKAQRDLGNQGKPTLEDMFGSDGNKDDAQDALMVDRADLDSEEEGVDSDGDG
ncbi:hypothetical protein EG329_009016 [Mollisiaceae sp. DMI_Dod_QoI]|nr:hypothetical protein EG329_009016 [Helotiales sp. DMI_Dod_QoI]